MIEIIKELDVEVTKQNIFQAIVAKQYDMNTRFLKVTFMDCGNRIDIPYIETAKVVINAERKDGQSDAFEGVINDDGTVTVPLHSWMLQLDGTVICDISVIDTAADNNKKLTTTSFTLIVEKAAYGGEDVTSDPQYDVLVSLLGTCASASEAAQEALDKSNEALKKSSEANSKYDACVEATNNANAVREEIEAGGYIESLKELNEGGKFSFWVGTQAEYDALGEKQGNTLHLITDDTTEADINAQISDLQANEGKMTLIFDYTKNGNKALYEGDEINPLTTQTFPLYYISILNTSSTIIAGGVYWTDGTNTAWAIRGSGCWVDESSVQEIFVNMRYGYQTKKLTINRICSLTHNITSSKFSIAEGQGIARIYGFGKL